MLGTFYHSPDGGGGGGRSGAKGSKSTKRGDGERLALLRAFVMAVPAQYGERLEKFVTLCDEHKSKLSANSFREILGPIAVKDPNRAGLLVNLFVETHKAAPTSFATLVDNLRSLQVIFEKGPLDSQRFVNMAISVAASRAYRSYLRTLIEAFSSASLFKGTSYALEKFCLKMGSMNPFEAAASAKVRYPTRSPKDSGGVSGEVLTADSTGGKMTAGEVYRVSSSRNPELPHFVSGVLALTHIMQVFHPDEKVRTRWAHTPEEKAELKRELGKRLKEQVLNELLDRPVVRRAEELAEEGNLEALPEAQESPEARSLNIRRKQAILEVLNAEIQAALEERAVLGAARRGWLPAVRRFGDYKVELQAAGVWLSWFEKELEERPEQMPDEIQEAFQEITNPHSNLSAKERDYYTRTLILYQARRTFMNRDLVLGDIQSDYDWYREYYEKHAGDDALKLQFGAPALLVDAAKHLLGTKAGVISFAELRASEASLAGVIRLRSQVNSSFFSQFSQDYQEALGLLACLFKDKQGKWLEDSEGESVPMARLKDTVAGAVLSNQELRAVRDALRYEFFSRPGLDDRKQFFEQASICDFRRIVETSAIAGRKVRHMLALLREKGVEFCEDLLSSNTEVSQEVRWKILKGGSFITVEEATGLPAATVLGKIRRARDLTTAYGYSAALDKPYAALKMGAVNFGLCVKDQAAILRNLMRRVDSKPFSTRRVYSAEELEGDFREYDRLRSNWLVVDIREEKLTEAYLNPDRQVFAEFDVERLRSKTAALTELIAELEGAKAANRNMQQSFETQRELITQAVFLQGGIRRFSVGTGKSARPVTRLDVRACRFAEIRALSLDQRERERGENEQQIVAWKKFDGFSICHFRPEGLRPLIVSLESSATQEFGPTAAWVSWNKLPSGWVKAVRFLSSRKCAEAVEARCQRGEIAKGSVLRDFGESFDETWRTLHLKTDFAGEYKRGSPIVEEPSRLLVSKELFAAVLLLQKELDRYNIRA